MKMSSFLVTLALMSTSAFAYEARLTEGQLEAKLNVLLSKASSDTGVTFKPETFLKVEDRKLATSRFQMYVQSVDKKPVAGTAVRIWSDLNSGELILGEMHLSEASVKNTSFLLGRLQRARLTQQALRSKQLSTHVTKMISEEVGKHKTDARILSLKSQDQWENNDLVRVVTVRGRRGHHTLKISLLTNRIVSRDYQEFPQADQYHSLDAHVFPIYEQVETTGEKLPTEIRKLDYISSEIRDGGNDPFGVFKDATFMESNYDTILADVGIEGKWSEHSLRREVEAIVNNFPLKSNDLSSGLLLQGKYATINIHANAGSFEGIDFDLKASTQHLLGWKQVGGQWSASPVAGIAGKPIQSQEELLNRKPERLADHNPVKYMNSGADEVQVYYAVTVLMDAMNEMGMTDPEYADKPFHAFLYDPDIGMRDNAYYVDNTINFTTYSASNLNYARDNSTIWHEIGHGIMERLMGAHLLFGPDRKSYGGLSEGIADFIAQIVVEHQTNGKNFPGKSDFRIINQTGFYATNEYHDDGEAYGGAMNDMLLEVIEDEGRAGLFRFTDLTLEAMRLSRNHPGLTPLLWFENMVYADSLGGKDRNPGQYKEIITKALLGRNFAFKPSFKPADMKVFVGNIELTSSSPGSRGKEIPACDPSGVVSYELKVKLDNGETSFIQFPATVKVEYKKGALQGAIKWIGEENNPHVYTVNSEEELLTIPLKASMTCDSINTEGEQCKDYAYLQVYRPGESKPIAKKRFYLIIKNGDTNCQK